MPKIFDNIELFLSEGLNKTLYNAKRADFCIGYFNLRGWSQLYNQIETLKGDFLPEEYEDYEKYFCRILIGMQKRPIDELEEHFYTDEIVTIDNAKAIEYKKKLAKELREQLLTGAPNNNDEIALQKLKTQLIEKKAIVKLYLEHPLHAKLYLSFRDDYNSPIVGFVGSSNLTFSGISGQGELNVDVVEEDAAKKLAKWFQERWSNRWSIDISKELIEILDKSWASEKDVPPFYIYLKTAYHLSSEVRSGISEFSLSKRFQEELFPYQANAVKVAAHHLHKRGGVIIGDVVGLGKTITATALAKIFEDDFYLETLVVCPKNLVNMWEDYIHQYQLRAKVMSITEVQNKLSGERRYRLVIIDESHNLRNREGKRFRAVQEYIREFGSKVILLTATPYNKAYTDLGSQLRLFLDEETNLGITPERFIESVGGKAQFLAQYQAKENTIAAFEKSTFPDDWNELMRLFLVRRTRSFIKNNYAQKDSEGKHYLTFPDGTKQYFPARIPKKVNFSFKKNDTDDQYARLYSEEVLDKINKMKFPRYGLGQENYINKNPKEKPEQFEEKILENLSRAGIQLKGFARTNLFKRLESSGYSFLLSISRQLLRNHLFLHAIENNKPLPIGKQETGVIDDYLFFDSEDDTNTSILNEEEIYKNNAGKVYEELAENSSKHYDWIRSIFFSPQLRKDILNDNTLLLEILLLNKTWDGQRDRKVTALINLCNKTHSDDKLLIFTQYSDTAYYLEKCLMNKVKGLCCVTGDDDDPTQKAFRFSPKSNNKSEISTGEEIRVLISTDVLSEGQNLQDGFIVVNFDLPWAIIRLIQRAGRVDRIGQKSDKIYCYSFLPEDGIEQIITLRKRLQNRIRENAETVGADEVFFEGDPVNIRDLYNEKSGILDEEDDNEVDLASYAFQIWQNAITENPKLKTIIPDLSDVIYSTKKNIDKNENAGAIVYARTAQDNDVLTWINNKKQIITQSQFSILKALKCEPDEKPLAKADTHHEIVKDALKQIKKSDRSVGGQLGKKNGARYRTYMRLTRHIGENDGTLFITDELKRAVEDIYHYPLREYANETLNRQLKMGVSDDDLGTLLVTLRDEGKLVIKNEDEIIFKEPKIICSMGLVNGD